MYKNSFFLNHIFCPFFTAECLYATTTLRPPKANTVCITDQVKNALSNRIQFIDINNPVSVFLAPKRLDSVILGMATPALTKKYPF